MRQLWAQGTCKRVKEIGGMKEKQHDYELNGTISRLSFLKHKPVYSWHEIGLIRRNKVAFGRKVVLDYRTF